jgi:hypothetical protein
LTLLIFAGWLLPPEAKPLFDARTLGQLLDDLKITKEALCASYGDDRTQWRPFGGPKNIRTILFDIRSDILKANGPRFRWKPVPDTFWSAPIGGPGLDRHRQPAQERAERHRD